jgi:hypothetical protein
MHVVVIITAGEMSSLFVLHVWNIVAKAVSQKASHTG